MLSRRNAIGVLGAGLGTFLASPGGAVDASGLPTAPAPPGLPALQRGVALGLFHEDPLWSYAGLLREIKDLGASHVALTVAYYQEHAGSATLYAHPRFTAPDATLLRTVREAHALGLAVMLFPIVRLESPRSANEWRGTLQPQDPAAWWHSYERLMLHLAMLAGREKLALLCIGSELSTLDRPADLPRWQTLCAGIRKVYRGLLTYSGNWDHYDQVGLYPLCDLAGLCAYFPLAGRLDPVPVAVEQLTAAWLKKRGELEAFAARVGRPLLLTEVGYLSQRGAAAWPWEEGAQGPVDLEDQRRCYQAFATAWAGASALRGVYFWNYYGWGGQQSRGYTPRHKPAAEELERYFLGEAGRPAQ